MRLLRRIEVVGFRSIQSGELDDLGNLTAIVGRNSSGKSNVLRALNLFFNGEVEDNRPIDFGRDHYEQEPRIREKKRVKVVVDFQLPENFKFRPGLKHLQGLGREFRITRKWELDPTRQPFDKLSIEGADDDVEDEDSAAREFIRLISYRYIPNRTVPAKLIRHESKDIAHSLFIRMKGAKESEQLLRSLDEAGERLLKKATESLERAGAPISKPTIATAGSLGEMISVSGFQARGPSGTAVSDEEWGAGHQAFFLYQLLHALDTNYGRFFGWRQATIWGVEEPESALHRDLESRLADKFREWTLSKADKLQVVQTTHSALSTMASDSGFFVELDGPRSKITKLTIPEVARRAEVTGVSGWTHPVLSFPWNPVVLVEGPIDVAVFQHVAVVGGFEHLRFLSLPKLDQRERGGGKNSMIEYLKRNKRLLQNRMPEAPLVALFDWEMSTQELRQARSAYGDFGERRVLRMNKAVCDPLMGPDFKGIERFYPPRVIREAHDAGEIAVSFPQSGPYSVSKSQLENGKGALLDRVRETEDKTELRPLLEVLLEVERSVRSESIQLELLDETEAE